MPTSAACRARASLTPSPRKPTTAAAPVRPHDARLLLRADPREDASSGDRRRASCSSSAASTSAPVTTSSGGQPDSAHTRRATAGLSPVTTLVAIPSSASRCSAGRRRPWAGRGTPAGRAAEVPLAPASRRPRRGPGGWRPRRPGCRRRTRAQRPPQRGRHVRGTAEDGLRCTLGDEQPARRRPRPATDTSCRSWSNGSMASAATTRRRAAGPWPRAPATARRPARCRRRPCPSDRRLGAHQPEHERLGVGLPSAPTARMKLIRPSVSVPVLSVNRTSTLPRSSMHTSRLTRTRRRARARDPVARLVDDDRGQQLRRDAHGDGQREQHGVDQGPVQHDVDDEDTSVSTAATRTSSIENWRSPTWKSVSGSRSPRPPRSGRTPSGAGATTTPADPACTTVPISAQQAGRPAACPAGTGATSLSTGATRRSAPTRRTPAGRAAAGYRRAPPHRARRSTTSPGTSSTTSTCSGRPSRTTTPCGGPGRAGPPPPSRPGTR